MKKPRGLLFDKDGTLFDFSSTWVVWACSFLREVGDNEAHAVHLGRAIGFDLQGRRFEADSIAIAGTPDQVALALHPHLAGRSVHDIVDLINQEAESAPQAEAVPLAPFLTQLKASGFALGVVTNDAETPARVHLRAAGVIEMFDFIAGFDSGYGAKPEPGPLLAFAQFVALPPGDIVMVGDSTHDLIAARAAGMRAVGVLTGLADELTLAPFAEVVLPHIGHLPLWIDTHSHD